MIRVRPPTQWRARAIAFVVLSSACGGADVTHSDAVVAHVKIAAITTPLAQLAKTSMTATATTSAGQPVATASISWSSLDQRIASIDASGALTPLKPGNARIVARSGAVADTMSITVSMRWLDISAPVTATCGVGGDSTGYCWGANVGVANHLVGAPRVPTEVPGGLRFGSITVGEAANDGNGRPFACGLTGAGKAYCWGWNSSDELGDGTVTPSVTPVAVAGNIVFRSIGATAGYACGLTGAGDVYCWGNDAYGQLGPGVEGSTFSAFPPQHIGGLPPIKQLASSWSHTCGLTGDGSAYCWGHNDWGEAGTGQLSSSIAPSRVLNAPAFANISAALGTTCGIAIAGGMYCWGSQYPGARPLYPTAYAPGALFTSITVADLHRCGTSATGVSCWGSNGYGQLGTGDNVDRGAPATVVNSSSFAVTRAGVGGVCALSKTGDAYCWGLNSSGVVGDGTTVSRNVPTRVLDPAP